MNVLVIPESFQNDQFILKPLFKRLFTAIGRGNVRVRVCQDPLLGGVGEALKIARIREVVKQHRGMTDLFILCVDRDGVAGRRAKLDRIEAKFGNGHSFLAENAWEEIETWTLAGLRLPRNWNWAEVRTEVHVKERFFEVLVRERGVVDGPGGGRKALGEEAANNVRRIRNIRQKCPEDFDALARRIEAATRAA